MASIDSSSQALVPLGATQAEFLGYSNGPSRTLYASNGQAARSLTMTEPDSLLHRVAAGEPTAAAAVVDQYSGLVWSLARKYFRDRDEAEDAVQDSFIALWKNAGRFDPGTASETTFVAMIARRRMIDRLRKVGRRIAAQPLEGAPEPENRAKGESETALEREEEVRRVLDAVDSLDPPQPDLIRHSLMEGMTHAEIAEKTDLPLGTVKTHIRRGLIKVREALGVTKSTR
ncbi:MAG: sigma-70 family RNA polymerase sigma factor [Planctomycetota bacterium]